MKYLKSALIIVEIIVCHIQLFFPKEIFAQVPDLGTASSFTLFTASGAFNNVGATFLTGNIGTKAGEFNGFPPGTLDGQIHIEDSISANAAADVEAAYNYLSGITCGIIIGTSLGNNQVLTPNVYCLGGAPSILNGDLILDGEGDSNALFIFKIDGALSTGSLSNIVLINSACWCNVYLQINGAFELGDSSVFEGTIIANGAINLLNGSSIIGRGLSRGGAINTNTITSKLSNNESPLPIELLFFKGYNKGDVNVIEWETASETNNNFFTICRTADGNKFDELMMVKGAGNTSETHLYNAFDEHPLNGVSYYRLKQTDFDGDFKYSNAIAISNDGEDNCEVSIYPNPSSGELNYSICMNIDEDLKIAIVDIYGRTLVSLLQPSFIGKNKFVFNIQDFPSGMYFIRTSNIFIQSQFKFAKN